jgi:hypothetical protein
VLTASGRQHEQAVERHDERDGFDELPAIPPGEPAGERGRAIDGNVLHRDHLVAELGRTDVAVPAGLSHRAMVSTGTESSTRIQAHVGDTAARQDGGR